MKPVTIIGGGLAGLSLGLALARSAVPVSLFEAGPYPRHRVCGEFIAGVSPATLENLGLSGLLADARLLRQTVWFHRSRRVYAARLPRPALGISRHRLDERLYRSLLALGATVFPSTRFNAPPSEPPTAREGRVWATGRQPARGRWIGLKIHLARPPGETDLEVHLGRFGYAGLSPVEDGRANVCGLFFRRPGIRARKHELLLAYLCAAGLGTLADRIAAAEPDPASAHGISGFSLHQTFSAPPDTFLLGDAWAAIPPFTGNGMSMAFEAAECALAPLLAWSRGETSWLQACTAFARARQRRFALRLGLARALHPFLFHPAAQPFLTAPAALRLLPFRTVYHLTHH